MCYYHELVYHPNCPIKTVNQVPQMRAKWLGSSVHRGGFLCGHGAASGRKLCFVSPKWGWRRPNNDFVGNKDGQENAEVETCLAKLMEEYRSQQTTFPFARYPKMAVFMGKIMIRHGKKSRGPMWGTILRVHPFITCSPKMTSSPMGAWVCACSLYNMNHRPVDLFPRLCRLPHSCSLGDYAFVFWKYLLESLMPTLVPTLMPTSPQVI